MLVQNVVGSSTRLSFFLLFFPPISTVRVFFPEYKKLYHCITDLVNSYFVPLFFNVSKCLESNHMDYYASNLIFRVLRYLYRKCSSWNLQILHCLDLHFVDMLCCVMFSFMLSEVNFFYPCLCITLLCILYVVHLCMCGLLYVHVKCVLICGLVLLSFSYIVFVPWERYRWHLC